MWFNWFRRCEMNERKLYSTGELAKLSGTTIRTIQYYDKVNLLPAKWVEHKHLRYYTPSDLLTLQQILFYKKLGFSLKDIQAHLVDANHLTDITPILKKQSDILFRKELELKTNIAIIEAILATVTDSDVDVEQMIKMVLGLNKQTVFDYMEVEFDKGASEKLEKKFANDYEVLEFYWEWKQLTLEAVFYKIQHTSAFSEAGYKFGKRWYEFSKSATNGDPELIAAFDKTLEDRHKWPEEDLFLYNFCHDFIDDAYRNYCEK